MYIFCYIHPVFLYKPDLWKEGQSLVVAWGQSLVVAWGQSLAGIRLG